MTFYECHVTRDRGYAPIAFLSPPRPERTADKPGCVNFNEKLDGRCRVTGRACDATPVAAPATRPDAPEPQGALLGGDR